MSHGSRAEDIRFWLIELTIGQDDTVLLCATILVLHAHGAEVSVAKCVSVGSSCACNACALASRCSFTHPGRSDASKLIRICGPISFNGQFAVFGVLVDSQPAVKLGHKSRLVLHVVECRAVVVVALTS